MGLQELPSGERIHIGFFGKRNAGKSSLVNAVTGQELSVVSDTPGTTTDAVQKAMELLPLGPVVIVDTPGYDDTGELGKKRIARARRSLEKTDIAVLVVDHASGCTKEDREVMGLFQEKKLPYLITYTKADLYEEVPEDTEAAVYVSALTGYGIETLKKRLGELLPGEEQRRTILAGMVTPGDMVVLVIPVDESAPKGRLILPQQMVMRELLDRHAAFLTCQVPELRETLQKLKAPPQLVITDSQAFHQVSEIVPEDTALTSFSILFARYKGNLDQLIRGAAKLSELKEHDRVLIAEGCTHHRQCNDIGTVKLPQWIASFSGVQPDFAFASGGTFPEDISGYALVVHCGACMLNEAEMKSRLLRAEKAQVPMVNYGIAIAEMNGILKRSLAPLTSQ